MVESRTRLYRIWESMKRRCYNPDERQARYYRGIQVCQEWQKFLGFKEWALANGYKEGLGLSIERIDYYGNYEPNNCKWIPFKEQNINKRSAHFIEINGVTKTLTQWSREYGIGESTIRMRIKYGWSGERLLKEGRKRR